MAHLQFLLCCIGLLFLRVRSAASRTRLSSLSTKTRLHAAASGSSSSSSSMLITPGTIQAMMYEVADAIVAAKQDKIKIGVCEVPLPVTGGTELDDFPGGIKQKAQTLTPMLVETMRRLNFTQEAIGASNYFGGEIGVEDAIGIWSSGSYTIISFATPESLDELRQMLAQPESNDRIIVLVNPQIFLDDWSLEKSKVFMSSMDQIYCLQQLNLKGVGGILPVRGILYRTYPKPFFAGRRLDAGGYINLKAFAVKPPRFELEELFLEDSSTRDANLTFADKVRKLVPNFGYDDRGKKL